MRRKQIINPLVGYARRAIGPFSYRIGQSTYAQTFGRRAQEVFSMLGFGADADGRIRMLPRGAGSVTFTRDTAGSLTDFESLVQTGQVEEMRFDEARRVENQLDSTEDFSGLPWVYFGGAYPEGTNEIIFSDQNSGINQIISKNVRINDVYGFSVELWGSGTLSIRILDSNSTEVTGKTITLTQNARRYFVSHTFLADATGVRVEVVKLATSGETAERAEINVSQLENLTGHTNQNPSEYVSNGVLSGTPYHGLNVDGVAQFAHENGNTVDGNGVVTEAKGADLTTEWGALFEPASTNEAPQSLDFTTGAGAWTAVGDCSTSETSTLSPVLYRNWWKLAAVAGGASNRRITTQNITKDAAAEYWTQSIYVRKDEVTWARLEVYNSDASSYVVQYYDLTNGVIGTPQNSNWTLFKSTIAEAGTGNYFITLTVLTDALDTVIKSRVFLAQVGTGGGASETTLNPGEGMFIQGHQLEEKRVPTSLIVTDATAVTRTIDDGSGMFDLEGNLDQRKGSLVVDLRWTSNYDDISEEVEELIAVSQLTRGLLFYCSNPATIPIGLYSFDQTNLCKIDLPFVANKTYRIGLTWSVANGINLSWKNITDSGSWQIWANTPFDGLYTTVGTSIRMARPDGLYRPVLFRDLRIWQQDQGTDFIEDNY